MCVLKGFGDTRTVVNKGIQYIIQASIIITIGIMYNKNTL